MDSFQPDASTSPLLNLAAEVRQQILINLVGCQCKCRLSLLSHQPTSTSSVDSPTCKRGCLFRPAKSDVDCQLLAFHISYVPAAGAINFFDGKSFTIASPASADFTAHVCQPPRTLSTRTSTHGLMAPFPTMRTSMLTIPPLLRQAQEKGTTKTSATGFIRYCAGHWTSLTLAYRPGLGILGTSRQLDMEASVLLWRTGIFYTADARAWKPFLNRCIPAQNGEIRMLHISTWIFAPQAIQMRCDEWLWSSNPNTCICWKK